MCEEVQPLTPGFEITVEGSNSTATIRFWRKVRVEEACWVWTGAPNASGYGKFRVGGSGTRTLGSHVVSWSSWSGREPEYGIHLHHLREQGCLGRLCVRPGHLREMPHEEHLEHHYQALRARETCVHGHDLTDSDNVYFWNGVRHCRPCRRNNDRRRLGIPYEKWKIKDSL